MDTNQTSVIIPVLNENQRRLKYFEKNLPLLLEDINKFNIKYNINNFSILLYHYYNNIEFPCVCKICGKELKFISFNKGYNKYCSKKCAMSDKDLIKNKNEKAKKTNLEKYGVDNPMKLNNIKEKVKETNLKKYGVDNYTKTDEYKEKVKETNLEKYGVEWYLQTDQFKNNSKISNIEKLGVDHHMKSNNFKIKLKNNNIEKWGVDNYSKTNDFKEKMKKYYDSSYFHENINNQIKSNKIKEINYYKNYNKEYELIDIKNDELILKCNICNDLFTISKQLYYLRTKNNNICCTNCNKTSSKNTSYLEKDVLTYIKEIYKSNIIENYKDKYEIDIYLPDINLGIEFNGLWYHSENYKSKTYHQDKTLYFKNKNINILHIWEDDWKYKNDIIKSIILNKIGKSYKIYARKCEIKEINDNKLIKLFLDNNHLQGYLSSSSIKIGLFYNYELVSLMTFGKSRDKSNNMELLRFCNKLNFSIIGGFSKLLNYYIKNYNFNKLITYADISHSNGNVYLKNNFILDKVTDVGYYWCKNGLKFNRFSFRKNKLIKNGNDPNKSENEIMYELGYYKLYNCGNYKFFINLI